MERSRHHQQKLPDGLSTRGVAIAHDYITRETCQNLTFAEKERENDGKWSTSTSKRQVFKKNKKYKSAPPTYGKCGRENIVLYYHARGLHL
jgi:hypothetical protein